MRSIYLLIGILLLVFPAVSDEITLSTDYSDYYFPVDDNAIIPFSVTSTFPTTVDAVLHYELSTESRRENNQHFQNFPVAPGTFHKTIHLTSKTEVEYYINLTIFYNHGGILYSVELPSIGVHFVEKRTGSTEQGDKLVSNLTEVKEAPTPVPTSSPDARSWYTHDIQKQAAKKILNESLFIQVTDALNAEGYKQSSATVNMIDDLHGSIQVIFERDGNVLEVNGAYDDESVTELNVSTDGDLLIPDTLKSNDKFQKYLKTLKTDGFNEISNFIKYKQNVTDISKKFVDQKGNTKTLFASLYEGEVNDVRILEPTEKIGNTDNSDNKESNVSKDDITISTENSEYYFKVGTDASVPFTIKSNLKDITDGNIRYELSTATTSSGYSFSQSNEHYESIIIPTGTTSFAINLSSQNPADYKLDLTAYYMNDGVQQSVVIPQIGIHFIEGSIVPENSGNTQSSTTRPANSGSSSSQMQSSPSSITSPSQSFTQMEDRMNEMREEQERMMQQFMSSSQAGMQNQPSQQSLQNNQMNSESETINQLEQESKKIHEEQQKVADKLSDNPLIKETAEFLQKEGYNQTSGTVNLQNDGTGTFAASFEASNGDMAEMTGKYENGSVSELSVTSPDSLPIPDSLKEDQRYNEAKDYLKESSFQKTDSTITSTLNETRVTESYIDSDNSTATLNAKIEDGVVTEVSITEDKDMALFWIIGIILIIALIIICLIVLYLYFLKNEKREVKQIIEEEIIEEPQVIDYQKDVLALLEDATDALSLGDEKRAYSLTGGALRMLISYREGNGSSLTNTEAIELLFDSEKEKMEKILKKCGEISYAGKFGSSDEALEFISYIRALLK